MTAPLTIVHPGLRRIVPAGLAALLTACGSGGGGGGGGTSTPAPTAQLEARLATIAIGQTTLLNWSSTDADTCQASGGWSGLKGASGSESVGPLTSTTNFTLQCTGDGGSATDDATVSVQAGNSTIAGELQLPTISRSDSDVNDPFAPFAPNDTDLQAQLMPNPVVIGGYVNIPNAGPDGRSFASGDAEDWYRMDLVAGQVIELVIPSASAIVGGDDADLRLFDLSLTVLGESDGTGQVEQITVPASGPYFIQVFAFDGAPLYRLSVGQATAASSGGSSLSLSDDFVPGEVIVTLKSAGDSAARTATSDAVLATRYKTTRKGGDPGRAMLLTLPT